MPTYQDDLSLLETTCAVIGWIVLGLFVVLGAILVYAMILMIIPAVRNFLKHLKTRNNTIGVGQVWSGSGHRYYVEKVLDDGRFVLKSGASSWGESLEEWKKRVWKERLRKVR